MRFGLRGCKRRNNFWYLGQSSPSEWASSATAQRQIDLEVSKSLTAGYLAVKNVAPYVVTEGRYGGTCPTGT